MVTLQFKFYDDVNTYNSSCFKTFLIIQLLANNFQQMSGPGEEEFDC